MIISSIECRPTSNKGWGMFTKTKLSVDTVIEISPVVVMTKAEMDKLNSTRLHDYIFDWDNDLCCMALGNLSIYNHACPSNCEYFQDYELQTIMIKTIRDIKANEELTINYNGDYDDRKEVWFEVKS